MQRESGAGRRVGDDATLCRALRNLGVVYVELGEFEEAEATYDEAIGVARELSDHMVFADLTNNLGTIMSMRGQWRRALDLYRPSLDIYVAAGERRKSAYCENNMGIAYSEQKLAAHASEYFEKAYQTATEIKDSSLKLIVNINIADLQLKTGNMDKARLHAREAEEQLAASGTVNGHLVETKKIAGMIAVADGNVETAGQRFSEALELARQIGAKFLEAEVLLERGKLHSRDGQNLDALADLESSYCIFKSLNAGGRRLQTEAVIHSIEQLYLETFEQMAVEVERKDEYTKGHSDRVATMSLLLAKQLGLQPAELKTIVAAALLHDIGKIKLDDAVLKKDGRLSDDEFAQIKQHPEYAVELLDGKEFPWDVRPSILAHHERLDGTGYPYALKGDDIPLPARIISIADVFDALTSDRVYRPAYDVNRALAIMEGESSAAFDPMLLDQFVEMVRDGRFDWVVNSKTPADEMYSIWSRCMDDDHEPSEPAVDPATMKRVAA